MTELQKPKSKDEFRLLLLAKIHSRNYPSTVGAQKSAAQEAHVSPSALGLMCRGDFPRAPVDDSPRTKEKRDNGAIFSLTRVCDTFGLDLETCLQLFGLPFERHVVEKSRQRRNKIAMLDVDGVAMLQQEVQMLGPIPIHLAVSLIGQFWTNKQN